MPQCAERRQPQQVEVLLLSEPSLDPAKMHSKAAPQREKPIPIWLWKGHRPNPLQADAKLSLEERRASLYKRKEILNDMEECEGISYTLPDCLRGVALPPQPFVLPAQGWHTSQVQSTILLYPRPLPAGSFHWTRHKMTMSIGKGLESKWRLSRTGPNVGKVGIDRTIYFVDAGPTAKDFNGPLVCAT